MRWIINLVAVVVLAVLMNGCAREEVAKYSPNVQFVGYYEGEIYDTYVEDDYAYLASRDKGLLILDVSEPDSPQEVGYYIAGDIARAVYVQGDYAYLLTDTGLPSNWNSRLHVIDVSDPSRPREVGEQYIGGSAVDDIYVSGNYVYIGSGQLHIYDVSDPAEPLKVKVLDVNGGVTGIDLLNDYAFCSTITFAEQGKLVVVDVADPSAAVTVSTYAGGYPYAYAFGVAVQGDYAYVARDNGLQIVDISIPSSPNEVGYYLMYRYPLSLSAVHVSGDYAYVTYCTTGLEIIDVSDPSNPSQAGYYELH
ncbi:MAG TPA: hypothetical protein EYP53_10690, partial [Candidatus Latescibacteria bacterium]|nr:hypothetical protein [Candidatus Latescibacterota bacterium]